MRPYGWKMKAMEFAPDDRTMVPAKFSRARAKRAGEFDILQSQGEDTVGEKLMNKAFPVVSTMEEARKVLATGSGVGIDMRGKNYNFKQIMPPGARGTFQPDMYTREHWIAEEKLDGDRRIAQFCLPPDVEYFDEFQSCEVRFTGRRVNKDTKLIVEKTGNVPHLSGWQHYITPEVGHHLAPPSLRGTVLDGEMTSPIPGARSKDVTSIMGSSPEKAIAKQKERGWLVYVVFDCLFYKGQDIRDLPLFERRRIAEKAIKEWGNPYVRFVSSAVEDREQFLMKIWGRKHPGEGVILKDLYSKYGDEKAWVKVKREFTEDAVVIGFDPPEQMTEKTETYLDENGVKQKRVLEVSESRLAKNGWIGAIRFGQYKLVENDLYPEEALLPGQPPVMEKDGKKFVLLYCGSCSGMDDLLRADISAHPEKYLGQVVEILANEREETGRFRHPRMVQFRDNKNAFDCIWGQK